MSVPRSESSRRGFILATASQILLAGETNTVFAEEAVSGGVLTGIVKLIAEKFSAPRDLPMVFFTLLEEKLNLSLSSLENSVRQELDKVVEIAIARILKEATGSLTRPMVEKIVTNTIYFQNMIIAASTDKTGNVLVQKGIATKTCIYWPYC